MEELWQGQAGTGESQTMYGAFPAFPHFPNLSCSTTPAHFIFLNEPRVSVQQHKSQNTIMSFPSCGNVPCPGVGRSLTFQWTLCRISSVIIFPWWSEAERWIQQKKQNQNFLLQVKANALLTISQVRGFFPLENVYRHVFDHRIGNMSWEHTQICARINAAARSHLTVITRHPGAPWKLSVGLEGIQPGESRATMWLGWTVPQENCALMNGKRSKRELQGRACEETTGWEPSCA